jgi:hypothetical protein
MMVRNVIASGHIGTKFHENVLFQIFLEEINTQGKDSYLSSEGK